MSNHNQSIHQLTENMNILSVMMVKNESRYISIEKSFRWFAVAFICLTMLVFFIGFNMMTKVNAGVISDTGDIIEGTASIENYIISFFKPNEGIPKEQLSKQQAISFFKDLNGLIKNMNTLTGRVVQDSNMLLGKKPDFNEVGDKGTGIMQALGAAIGGINGVIADNTHSGVGISQVFGETFVLLHRLKLDSDSLRNQLNVGEGSGLFTGHSEISRTLGREIRLINETLRVMTHSMGPTMGRMGTMMNNTPIMSTVPW